MLGASVRCDVCIAGERQSRTAHCMSLHFVGTFCSCLGRHRSRCEHVQHVAAASRPSSSRTSKRKKALATAHHIAVGDKELFVHQRDVLLARKGGRIVDTSTTPMLRPSTPGQERACVLQGPRKLSGCSYGELRYGERARNDRNASLRPDDRREVCPPPSYQSSYSVSRSIFGHVKV